MLAPPVRTVDVNCPVLTSQEYIDPLAHEVQSWEEEDEEVMESIGEVVVALDSVRMISPCRGEKTPSVPFEKPSTRHSSDGLGAVVVSSFAEELFLLLFFFFLADSSSSSSPSPSATALSVLAAREVQCTADTRASPKTDSATTFPDSESNTRNRCLSTARATCAKSRPEAENDVKDEAEEASAMIGSERAAVETGRLLSFFR